MYKQIFFLCLVFSLTAPCLFASSEFLWKPESESDHKLVILFPAKYRQEKVKSIAIHYSDGKVDDNPTRVSQNGHNGDRLHARFRHHGRHYGLRPLVVLTLKNGNEIKWRVEKHGKDRYTTHSAGSGSMGSLDDVLSGGKEGVKKGDVNLTEQNQGTKEYIFEKDGEAKVTACLRTYGKARLRVDILRKGSEKKLWLLWRRTDDSDSSPLYVDGKADKKSMFEENPGDMSARAVTHKIKVAAGDKMILILEGNFGGAGAKLSMKAP